MNEEKEPLEENQVQEEPEELATQPDEVLPDAINSLQTSNGGEQPDAIPGTETLEFLFDLELPISIELARKDMQIQDILNLGEGAIIEFDKLAGENVEVLVNNKKIAEGEVVVIDERFGVRIVSLINPSERIKGITEEAYS